jgi:hypothetical protein
MHSILYFENTFFVAFEMVSVSYGFSSIDVSRQESCYLWIFDCHWGPYNTDVLWSYDAGASTDLLFNTTWKIAI